ncbi:hypothetical protein V6N13_072827 [Hibiscus sabdariffa]|uniref:UMP kinase n=1 Tax=Hibiscus sabdariffa TaxID=183260 RepID=A0ABR2E7B2_9ROSI
MASSIDDDLSLLDDHQTNPNHLHVLHHHHPSYAHIHAPPPDNHDACNDSDFTFRSASFGNNAISSDLRIEKRRDQTEMNDGALKRPKQSTTEYRKDREEWSDTAIGCLLEAYMGKLIQLNRGNLRGRDWEEVAVTVSERCEKQSKSVEQCKNKAVSDEDKAVVSLGTVVGQPKRYVSATSTPAGQVVSMKSKTPKWRRVVFKISGAALACSGPHNIDPKVVMRIAREIAIACRLGVEVAIVVGGRNLFCGDTWITATGLDRSTAYQVGMMASVMNSILLQSSLERIGVQTSRVVIFGGIGTGNPLFSTDTAAALRASEIHAEAVLKGINADGTYDCPSQDNNATFEHISFRELISIGATAMDMMALTFCDENSIPVVVFNLLQPGNISKALCGDEVGTLVDQTGRI